MENKFPRRFCFAGVQENIRLKNTWGWKYAQILMLKGYQQFLLQQKYFQFQILIKTQENIHNECTSPERHFKNVKSFPQRYFPSGYFPAPPFVAV